MAAVGTGNFSSSKIFFYIYILIRFGVDYL